MAHRVMTCVQDLKAGDRFKDLAEDSNCFSKTMVCRDSWNGSEMTAVRLEDKFGEMPVSYEYADELVELVK